MPEPSSEERLLRGLAELEATRFGGTDAAATKRPAAARDEPPAGPRHELGAPPLSQPSAARSLRRRGPLVALVPPVVLGLVAVVLLQSDAPSRRGVLGFVAAVVAAPALLVAGVPLRSGAMLLVVACAASMLLWLVLGWWAARRARSWPGFALELGWMILAVWAGVGLAALLADLVLGRPLL